MSRHTPPQIVQVLLAGLLMTATFAGPAAARTGGNDTVGVRPDVTDPQVDGATAQSTAPTQQRTPMKATITLKRLPNKAGRIEVTAVYTHQVSNRFGIKLPKNRNVNVRGTSGFTKAGANTYVRSGSAGNPSITYRIDPNASTPNPYANNRLYSAVDVGKWALVRGSSVSPTPTNPVRQYWWEGQTYKPQGKGVVVGDIVYLGPYRERTRQISGQRLRVIVTRPANGVPMTPQQTPLGHDSSVAGLMDTMDNVSGDFQVGERDSTVTVLLGPTEKYFRSEAEDAGFLLNTNTYGSSNTPVFSTRTAIHEYVHTRQSYSEQTVARTRRAGEQTAWLIEGQAQYYEHLFACREGLITSKEFKRALRRGQQPKPVLADKSTWPSQRVKYEKGALVLAALDVQIRKRTNGRKTLQDVFLRLNGHTGEINHSVLEDTVAAVAGTRMDSFLTTYVRRSNAPSVPSKTACNRKRTLPAPEPCQPVGIEHVGTFCREGFTGLECPIGICDVPGIVGLTDNERALLHVGTDGTRFQYYLVRIDDGEVTEFRRVEDPSAVDQTINVRTDAETVRDVWAAESREEAVRQAVRADRITVDGVGTGLGNRARLFIWNVSMDVYVVATDVATAIADTLNGVV